MIKQSNKTKRVASSQDSSDGKLIQAIVNTIEEMKLLWSHTTYDGRVAVEKHIEYLTRVLKESGYNV
jgi:hypothetical protein